MAMFQDAAAVVYTDGACLRNGQKDAASAGVGVFWGEGDPRNVSRLVRGTPTNNVAELEAVEEAVDAVLADAALATSKVVIATDSQYSINVLRTWYDGFVRRGWTTAAGAPVANQDLICRIHAKLPPTVVFAHIRGHRDHVGNIAADRLAGAAIPGNKPAPPKTKTAAAAASRSFKRARK